MNIKVDVNNVKIQDLDKLNTGEYNIHSCNFIFTEEYENLILIAIFSKGDEKYKVFIEDNNCIIPSELLQYKGYIKIGVYAYKTEEEDLILRYSPKPTTFYVEEGSYKEADESEQPTPSEIEQIEQQIHNLETSINNFDDEIQNLQTSLNEIGTQLNSLRTSFDELNEVALIKEG